MGKGVNHNLPKNKNLEKRAKELRKAGNLSEVLLWLQIKNGQLNGLDFDRQVVIGNYIVDFFCAERRVIIEIDGITHDYKGEYDEDRSRYLKGLGLSVIRVMDIDIKKNIQSVVDYLRENI